jgi:hypothetical protein
LTINAVVGRSSSVSTPLFLMLLVFGGPIGWLVLLLLSPGHPGEQLSVTVPWTVETQATVETLRRQRRHALAAAAVGAVILLGTVLSPSTLSIPQVVLQLVVGGLLAGTVLACGVAWTTGWRIARVAVGVELDASRRWVTLTNVHPAFVRAVERDPQQRRQHAP